MPRQRYYCHVCNAAVELPTNNDAALSCPTCQQGFLEERNDEMPMPGFTGTFFVASDGPAPPPFVQQLLSQFFGLGGPVSTDDEAGGLFGAAEHGQPYGQGARAEVNANDQVPVQNLASFLSGAFGTSPNQQEPAHERGAPDETAQQTNPIMRLFQTLGGARPMAAANGPDFNFVFGGGNNGQFGDYATQAGFNGILQQLFEQAQGNYGPRALPDEAIDELPKVIMSRELLDSPTISDCAICKDEFAEGDEASKLPCRHIMHTDCIKPWLQQSGTCPVCRHQLIEQPASHTAPAARAHVDEASTLHDDDHAPPVGDNAMPGAFPQAFIRIFTGPTVQRPPPAQMPDMEDLD